MHALAVALLWVLHPLNTEAVDYLTQRTESMMALFYLLTLYASIRAWSSALAKWEVAAVVASISRLHERDAEARRHSP